MSDFVTPRINAALRQQFANQDAVRLIGKVKSADGDNAVMDCSGEVQVNLDGTVTPEIGNYYEIVGKVNPDLSIRMMSATDFGTNIDLAVVDKFIQMQHKHNAIFY